MFSFNHFRRWETHLACEMQVALNYTAFSVSEISVFDHVYVGCNIVLMNIPQKIMECGSCLKLVSPLEIRTLDPGASMKMLILGPGASF